MQLNFFLVVTPSMIAETSERSHQGFWQGLFGTVISMGLFTGTVVSHPSVRKNRKKNLI